MSNSSVEPRKRTRRRLWFLLAVPLLVLTICFAGLLAEHCRGHWALNRWKQHMAAKGEAFEASQIWPQPTPEGRAFSNQLSEALAQLPSGLDGYAGRMSAIVLQEPGLARRGSQEPNPAILYLSNGTNRQEEGSWAGLEQLVDQAQPALHSLRALLKNPPADAGQDVPSNGDATRIPNFVGFRKAAQALQARVLFDLHRGDLEGAKDNLVALAAITRLHAREPILMSYMIRIAVLGLGTETGWDALQAEGWTEAQLAELQQAFQCDELLAQLPRTLAADRVTQLYELDWFSSHSYLAWVARYHSIYESIGFAIPESGQFRALRYWREWLFHPLWCFAWADQEKLHYLQHSQRALEIVREATQTQTGSGCQLDRRLKSLQTDYQPPAVSWRFYLAIPWMGQASEKMAASLFSRECPYADFRRAMDTSIKNLTLCQMLRAAVAVKRYELRHGKLPQKLEALVPEFVAEVPRDLMSGQPLRYELHEDSCRLYSVADDGQDDGGNPLPAEDTTQFHSPWNGRDWLWPVLVR